MRNLKTLKKEAHDWATVLWGGIHEATGEPNRMYRWMQLNTRTGHIATLDERELREVIKKLKRLVAKNGVRV